MTTDLTAKTASTAADPSLHPGGGLPDPVLAEQAIAEVLRPLARLMIDHGVQLPSLVDMLKKALVEQAELAYGLADKGSSDTRISLLTGVHRKDVKRLRQVTDTVPPASPIMPIASSVVARWISEPRFLHADQTPRQLARTPTRGNVGEPDFTTLVAEVSRDVGARAVLDELVRLGVVESREDGFVALKSNSFVPKEGLRESFHFLGTNVGEHLAAAVHNLRPAQSEPFMLEQSAFSEDLSATQADLLQQRARQLWTNALQQFLQSATVAWQRSEGDAGLKHRVRFGVYFHDKVQAVAADPLPPVLTPRQTKRKSNP
jgi:hypothetical protein